jgi:hypothetical protein
MMTFSRTTAYRAAINQLADAIAAIPIAELAPTVLIHEIGDDLDAALERRHRRFSTALSDSSYADSLQCQTERRKASARKAAVTRARKRASLLVGVGN